MSRPTICTQAPCNDPNTCGGGHFVRNRNTGSYFIETEKATYWLSWHVSHAQPMPVSANKIIARRNTTMTVIHHLHTISEQDIGVALPTPAPERAHNPDMLEMCAMRRRAGQTSRLMTTTVSFERRGYRMVDAYNTRRIAEEILPRKTVRQRTQLAEQLRGLSDR